mgnify:CR=1 FL=1
MLVLSFVAYILSLALSANHKLAAAASNPAIERPPIYWNGPSRFLMFALRLSLLFLSLWIIQSKLGNQLALTAIIIYNVFGIVMFYYFYRKRIKKRLPGFKTVLMNEGLDLGQKLIFETDEELTRYALRLLRKSYHTEIIHFLTGYRKYYGWFPHFVPGRGFEHPPKKGTGS